VNASRRGGDGSTATITSLASLLSTPTSELLRPQASILCLDPGSTVGEALAALAARRVLSAPVRTLEAAAAAAGSSPSKKKIPEGTTKEFEEASEKATAEGRDFVCFVDVRDVLMSFLEVIPRGSLDGAKLLKRAKVLEEAGSRLSEMPLSSLPVIGSDGAFLLDDEEREDDNDDDDDDADNDDGKTSASASAAAAALSSSMPLRSLLSGFLVGGGGGAVSAVRQGEFPRAKAVAHRVALLSPKKKKRKKKVGEETSGESVPEERQRVTHIVSQLDVARFVIKNAAVLWPLALKTAAELGELLFFGKISLFLFFFFSFFFLRLFFLFASNFSHTSFSFPSFLSLFSLTLSGWAEGKVVTVPPTTPAIEALAAMRRAGVAGLAVVENASAPAASVTSTSSAAAESNNGSNAILAVGAMIGSFAVPDLRALVCEHLGSLALPVGEALAKAKGREFWGVARSGNGTGGNGGNGGNGGGGERSGNATPVGSFGGRGGGFSSTPLSNSAVGTPLFGTSPRDANAAAAAARRASIGGRVGQALATASPDYTFSVVLARLVARRVHRLHVIDDETSAPLVRRRRRREEREVFFPFFFFFSLFESVEGRRRKKKLTLLFFYPHLSKNTINRVSSRSRTRWAQCCPPRRVGRTTRGPRPRRRSSKDEFFSFLFFSLFFPSFFETFLFRFFFFDSVTQVQNC
jgi:uncharacterized membrane protein YgcG